MELNEQRGRKMKGGCGSLCIPGVRGNQVWPRSLLEPLRRAVFRLIMLSAISRKQDNRSSCKCANGARPYRRHDSRYSEAVADCIEFIKKSASEEAESARDSLASSTAAMHVM